MESFIRGPARLVVMEDTLGDLVESISDIFVLDPGPQQFDTRPGVYDIGAVKSGVKFTLEGHIVTLEMQVAEMTWAVLHGRGNIEPLQNGSCTLATAWQDHNKLIRIALFPESHPMPVESMPDLSRGECSTVPIKWWCPRGQGKIMQQFDV
jgi:hypothetical protein